MGRYGLAFAMAGWALVGCSKGVENSKQQGPGLGDEATGGSAGQSGDSAGEDPTAGPDDTTSGGNQTSGQGATSSGESDEGGPGDTGGPGDDSTGDEQPPESCNNGVIDPGEDCDGDLLNGHTCSTQGFATGDLGCNLACAFDTTGCFATCGEPAPPTVGPCPAQCDSCSGGTCHIACGGAAASCVNMDLNCPAGYSCEVVCTGTQTCVALRMQCPPDHDCTLICNGIQACSSAELDCEDGNCQMVCNDDPASCSSAEMICGAESCTASCDGASTPQVTCGPTCDCSPC